MTRIVAAHVWVCELCNYPLYEKKDMLEHLKEKHNINPNNLDTGGDNLMEAQYFTVEHGSRLTNPILNP